MEFDQILIRLGVDGKAVAAGLQKIGSFIKGWAGGLMHDLQHHVVGRLAGLFVVEKLLQTFEKVAEKALFLRRLSKETGLGTNFLQGAANELNFVGEDFEKMEKPIGRLSVLFGQAKLGIAEARQKLVDWGIVAKTDEINSLSLEKGLINLKRRFDAMSGHEQKGALLQAVFGKGYQAVFPLFELEMKKFEKLGKSSFLEKLTPGAIETFAEMSRTGKGLWNMTTSTLGNLFNVTLGTFGRAVDPKHHIEAIEKEMGRAMTGKEALAYMFTGAIPEADKLHKKVHETTEEMIEQVKIQQQINEQEKLRNQLQDRGKFTVTQLADRAREILGDRRPRGLAAIHTVTPAMASALQVQRLEDRASIANLLGNTDMAHDLFSKAKELRIKNWALTSTEREPMLEIEQKLELITRTLDKIGMEGIKLNIPNH